MHFVSVDVWTCRIYVAVFDVESDYAAEDDAGVADFESGVLAALQGRMRLCETGRLYLLRGSRGESGHLDFADLRREVGCANVHLIGDVFGDDVDDEFSGAADVAGRVFWNGG